MTVGWAEQTAQLGRRERSLMVLNSGDEYAEKMCRAGGFAGVVSTLIASRAWRTPIVPTTGPTMPPSAQLRMLVGGGGRGNTQR